jgi:hypothetical protein
MHLLSARRVVGVTLLGRLTRSWVERDLQGGDLSCLRDFALFRNRRPASAVIDRLCERRFMAKTACATDNAEGLDRCPSPTNCCAKGLNKTA